MEGNWTRSRMRNDVFRSLYFTSYPHENEDLSQFTQRKCAHTLLLLVGGVDVGESALAAVLAVEVGGHEDAGAALLGGALPPQAVDLAVVVNPVVLKHGKLDLLVLVLDLLGGGVVLLLPLLAATAEAEDEVKGRLWRRQGDQELATRFTSM